MELECGRITKVMLPAIRVYAAEQLSAKYSMKQSEIAGRLGIAQVAVSKYLSGKYSKTVKKAKAGMEGNSKIDAAIARMAKTSSMNAAEKMVNDLCTSLV